MSPPRIVQPRSVVPTYIAQKLGRQAIWLASGGDSGGSMVHIDLEQDTVQGSHSSGRGKPVSVSRALGAAERAEILALAEAVWCTEIVMFQHPQTVVGEEVLVLTDGEETCYAQAYGGWFTSPEARALMARGRALLEA